MWAVAALMLTACGEDRTHEYEELTVRDHWMMEVMQREYLWGDQMKELEWRDYFAKPTDFFAKLTAQAPISDTWSWCSIDTLMEDHHERGYFNHLDSYGMDFVVMVDPTGGTSRQYGRVMTVYADSPAARAGLQRGDFISSVDGSKFTSTLAKRLINGKKHTLGIEQLGYSAEETAPVWTGSKTLDIEASEYVEDVAFPVHNSYETSSGTVGYLLCNRLTEGPTEKAAASTAYRDALDAVMAAFSTRTFSAFVLDLRLCNDGTIDMARRLASYLVGTDQKGSTFARTIYNSANASRNATITFDDNCIDRHLDIQTLYIITSGHTSGAAEWLIRGIRKAKGNDYVITVGKTTNGQVVMTSAIPSSYQVTLHPAVCYVADVDGDHDYAAGLTPDIDVDEQTTLFLYPYGDTREVLLNAILTRE